MPRFKAGVEDPLVALPVVGCIGGATMGFMVLGSDNKRLPPYIHVSLSYFPASLLVFLLGLSGTLLQVDDPKVAGTPENKWVVCSPYRGESDDSVWDTTVELMYGFYVDVGIILPFVDQYSDEDYKEEVTYAADRVNSRSPVDNIFK